VGKLKDHYLRQEEAAEAATAAAEQWCPECKENQPLDRHASKFTSGDALACGHPSSGMPARRSRRT